MAKLDVLNWNKDKVEVIDWPEALISSEVRKDILYSLVRWQLNKKRQGTHSVKTRETVRGSGIKPYKQKGTGNARRGSTRTPLTKGGAVLFGPSPRSYEYHLPKKIRQAGLKNALSYLHNEQRLFVVDKMEATGKTRELSKILKKFGLEKAVLVDDVKNDLFSRASKNLPNFVYNPVEGLNVYDLLKYDTLVLTKQSLAKVFAKCGVK
jgi:large subunit ribosomal protein L4